MKLETGPWLAIMDTASVHLTLGGIRISSVMLVLNEQGEPIPGLFTDGEVTGGIYGGNVIVDAVVFGRIAGERCRQKRIKKNAMFTLHYVASTSKEQKANVPVVLFLCRFVKNHW